MNTSTSSLVSSDDDSYPELVLTCSKHKSRILRVCSSPNCSFKLTCIVCRNEHSKQGHFNLEIREILNSRKILKIVERIRERYLDFVCFVEGAFFEIWREFDRQLMRQVREFESKMKWGRDTLNNPRFLAAKYGLDSTFHYENGIFMHKITLFMFWVFGSLYFLIKRIPGVRDMQGVLAGDAETLSDSAENSPQTEQDKGNQRRREHLQAGQVHSQIPGPCSCV